MNTQKLILLGVVVGAGWQLAGAAEGDPLHFERRVMVGGAVRAMPSDLPREPVTFLGVAVAAMAPVLSAQLRLPEGQGLVVTLVEDGSPAAKAGLQRHDVLRKLEDQLLIDPRQLSVLVRGRKDGETVTVTYLRAGAEARATVTLATQVQPPVRWQGVDSQDVVFRTESFGPEFSFSPAGAGAVNLPALTHTMPSSAAVRADRVMIFRPETKAVFSDEAGTLILSVDASGKMLTAKDAGGGVVFSGPVESADQRKALPDELRSRLEKLEALDVFEAQVPPPGFNPAEAIMVKPPVL